MVDAVLPPRPRVPWLALVVVAGACVRLLALLATQPTLPAGDEWDYFVRAGRLALGEPLEEPAARAPGAVLFYAAVFRLFHPSLLIAKLANVVLSSATLIPVHRLGRSLAGERAGLVAAGLAAFYPTFLTFSHGLWSEPLYLLLVAWGCVWIVRQLEAPAGWRPAAIGVVLALAALTREAGLLFPPLAALFLLWRRRRLGGNGLGEAAGLVLACVLTILPWTLHIQRPGEPFALVTRSSYMNLFIGNNPESMGWGLQQYPKLAASPGEREAKAREIALAHIASRLPWWPLEKTLEQVPRFFTPTSFAVRRLQMPAGDPGHWGYRFRWSWLDGSGTRWALIAISVGVYALVTLAGAAGLLLARRRDLAALFALFIASQILPVIVTFAISRFRLASMLFLILGCASLGVHARQDWRAASLLRRSLAGVAVVALLACMAMDFESVLRFTGN